jgi:chitinase
MGTGTVAAALLMALGGTSLAAADEPAADTTPPTVPQNLHVCGEQSGQDVICWDPSTDDSGVIRNYWVLVDGHQHARPRATTYAMIGIVNQLNLQPGTYAVSVLAVDPALNRSAPSDPIPIVIR